MLNFFRKHPLNKIIVQSRSSNSLSKKKWYINVREPFLGPLSIYYYLYFKMIHVILSFKLRPFSQPCFSLKSCFRCYSSLCLNQGNSCFFPLCVLLAWQKQFKSFLYLSTSFCLSLFLFSVGAKKGGKVLYAVPSLSALKHCQASSTSKMIQDFIFDTKPPCTKLLATHRTV